MHFLNFDFSVFYPRFSCLHNILVTKFIVHYWRDKVNYDIELCRTDPPVYVASHGL
jgi:hypothetical protein